MIQMTVSDFILYLYHCFITTKVRWYVCTLVNAKIIQKDEKKTDFEVFSQHMTHIPNFGLDSFLLGNPYHLTVLLSLLKYSNQHC